MRGSIAPAYDRAVSTVASRLAPIARPDPDGKPLRLGTLWQDGPAILLFLRQYG